MFVFGEKAGVAFQLLDDVIDLSADPGETGKVPGTDLRAGVPTMPYLRARAARRTPHPSPCARASTTASRASPTAPIRPSSTTPLAALREHDATAEPPSTSRTRGRARRSTPSPRFPTAPSARR